MLDRCYKFIMLRLILAWGLCVLLPIFTHVYLHAHFMLTRRWLWLRRQISFNLHSQNFTINGKWRHFWLWYMFDLVSDLITNDDILLERLTIIFFLCVRRKFIHRILPGNHSFLDSFHGCLQVFKALLSHFITKQISKVFVSLLVLLGWLTE